MFCERGFAGISVTGARKQENYFKVRTGGAHGELISVPNLCGFGTESDNIEFVLKDLPPFVFSRECTRKFFPECPQPRPQGSLLSCARNLGTSGQAQRHSGFEWLYKHNRLRPEPIRFVRLGRSWTWPEVAIPNANQKDRGLWEQDRNALKFYSSRSCIGLKWIVKETKFNSINYVACGRTKRVNWVYFQKPG